MFKKIYDPIYNDNLSQVKINGDCAIAWNQLKNNLTQIFILGSTVPVGKVLSDGFEFKLNYLNFFPMLPKVEVSMEDSESISIRQYYDSPAQMTQFFWFSVWLVASIFIFLFTLIGTVLEISEKGYIPIGVLVPISIILFCFFALYLGLRVRLKLWCETEEKTIELLRLLGIVFP